MFWPDPPPPRNPGGRLYVPRPIPRSVEGLLVRCEDFAPRGSSLLTLVKGVLAEGGLSVVYGAPAAGKSFLGLDFGASVATGVPWMGRTTKQGPVIYAAGEGVSGLRYRRTALMQARRLEKPPLAFLPLPVDVPGEPDTLPLVLGEGERMYGTPPALVILDTLSRYFGVGDENTARDMTRFIGAVDRMRQRYSKVHIMLIHHAGKDESKGMRGSSALKGAADTVIFCDKQNGRHVATVEKQKDGEEGLTFPFLLRPVEVGTDEDGEPITSCVVEPDHDGRVSVPSLTSTQTLAVRILCELARSDGLLKTEVAYSAYRERFCQERGSNDQSVRKAASRAIEDLRDKYHAVTWDKGESPIQLLNNLWQFSIQSVREDL